MQTLSMLTFTSGTPPTRVLTVNNPQLAASSIAMQNASVKELSKDNSNVEIKLCVIMSISCVFRYTGSMRVIYRNLPVQEYMARVQN